MYDDYPDYDSDIAFDCPDSERDWDLTESKKDWDFVSGRDWEIITVVEPLLTF